MLKKILVVVAVVVVGLLGFVVTRPASFHVERTATIHAPRALVFDLVNTMEKRRAWYPWDRLDPNMKVTYSGPAAGKGAHYAWVGNDDVGAGEQTILESIPGEKIVDSLHFTAPFEDTNTATFVFADEGENTKVTWSIDGGSGFSGKLMNVFMDMDKMLGLDFENGLIYLDQVAVNEKAAAAFKAAQAAAAPDAQRAAAQDDDEAIVIE
jgi:uncharacterized protein YndB with AHSA1/START domain